MISITSLFEESDPMSTLKSIKTNPEKPKPPEGQKSVKGSLDEPDEAPTPTPKTGDKEPEASIINQLKKSGEKSKGPDSPKYHWEPDKEVTGK